MIGKNTSNVITITVNEARTLTPTAQYAKTKAALAKAIPTP